MKKQRKVEKDNRGVAIYARKSRITNKGDSIGVQFKQCADYAKKELGLDEDYEFLQYEDKGLSGYFSDRPDFQRMLHDVQDGKIKAIVCYKLDRVGRKTADLIRLMDFLEMYHVDLLICSNGINTASGLYKIFIQIFAVIAEFERDTLTERIVDNMMELAKDGRWLGGNTPMGFTVRRVTTGSGKGKSAYSYLESLPEEKCMVQRLYEIFRTNRSIQSTAKHIAVVVDEIIIAAFISSTIDRISQNQSCGGCVKIHTGRSMESFLIHLFCSGLDTASGSKNFIQTLNHAFFFRQTF